MSNMSYCRFENTDRDLADCASVLEDLLTSPNPEEDGLSQSELDAAKSLVSKCFDIVQLVMDATNVDLETLMDRDTDKYVSAALDAGNAAAFSAQRDRNEEGE